MRSESNMMVRMKIFADRAGFSEVDEGTMNNPVIENASHTVGHGS